jgi:hypothetical protein
VGAGGGSGWRRSRRNRPDRDNCCGPRGMGAEAPRPPGRRRDCASWARLGRGQAGPTAPRGHGPATVLLLPDGGPEAEAQPSPAAARGGRN